MTGENAVPLGKAIHELRPGISESDVNNEVRRAEESAKQIEKETAGN
jgi:hypothetical protein